MMVQSRRFPPDGEFNHGIFPRRKAGRCAIMASGGIKTCLDAEGAIKMGADLVAVGRAVVVDPEWLSKVRSESEASILAGLPKDEREIAGALSIPPRMVEYLLSRPGWIPRFLRSAKACHIARVNAVRASRSA